MSKVRGIFNGFKKDNLNFSNIYRTGSVIIVGEVRIILLEIIGSIELIIIYKYPRSAILQKPNFSVQNERASYAVTMRMFEQSTNLCSECPESRLSV